MATGQVQPEFVERLQAIGQWMQKNGDTIYGTRGGPITPRSWGVSTQKGNTIYLHVLDWSDEYLALPAIPGLSDARLFGTNAKLQLQLLDGGMLLRLPEEDRNPVDTIVVLTQAG
jgi:alpha-L-fucosidase